MAAGPEIVRPAEDRPGLARLSLLAAASLAAGLFLAHASVQQNRWLAQMRQIGGRIAAAPARPQEQSEREPRPSAARPLAERGTPVAQQTAGRAQALAGDGPHRGNDSAEPPRIARTAPSASPPAPPAPVAVEPPAPAPGARPAVAPAENPLERRGGRRRIAVAPGRVAYLRCDGAPEQDGLFPCPRDRALEQRVFGAIAGLASCRELAATSPPPVGRADAWLIFHGPELGGIRMRESPGSEATSEIIRVCLEERLAGTRSRVESERMTVSFRFDLR